jgi:hypothetical protein
MTTRPIWISGLKELIMICACQSISKNNSLIIVAPAVLSHLTSSLKTRVLMLPIQFLMYAFVEATAISLFSHVATSPDLISRTGILLLPFSFPFVFMCNLWFGIPQPMSDRLAQAVAGGPR